MITLAAVYLLAGLLFAAVAVGSALDRTNPKRLGNALFWGLLSTSFLAGDHLGDVGNGVLVLALVAIAGFRGLGQGRPVTTTPDERRASAKACGDKLFLPALVIPATALLGTLLLKDATIGGQPLLDPGQVTLISLALGVVLAIGAVMLWLRPSPVTPVEEARRLLDAVGWAAVLPQMLASLGAVFALAGVGDAVGSLVQGAIPESSRFAGVLAYTGGMALFTIIMGNAFAAFPVMTAAVGLPILVHGFGGDPTVIGAIGMLAGFCGTLLTPMAANFNIVPAALLELKDRYGVIRAQAPTAGLMFVVNTALMYGLAFR